MFDETLSRVEAKFGSASMDRVKAMLGETRKGRERRHPLQAGARYILPGLSQTMVFPLEKHPDQERSFCPGPSNVRFAPIADVRQCSSLRQKVHYRQGHRHHAGLDGRLRHRREQGGMVTRHRLSAGRCGGDGFWVVCVVPAPEILDGSVLEAE